MEKNKKYIINEQELMEEWDYELNNKLDLYPDNITVGSHKKVYWKCRDCGNVWEAVVKSRTRKDGKATGCPECRRKKLSEYHSTPIVGINDFESNYPELVKEWNYYKNKDLKPSQFLKKSRYKVWWKCSICGNEYKTSIQAKTISGIGCPICSRKRTGDLNAKPIQGKNDFETLHPELLREWNYNKNTNLPSTYLAMSNKKVWWKCEYGHEWEASIVNRVKGRNCPVCKKEYKVSFPEKAIYYYVNKYYPNTVENYRIEKLENKELDIFIPELNIAIEYDGCLWHKDVEKDIKKDNICESLGIKVIRIREKGLPTLNSSSIIYNIIPSKDNFEYLKKCVEWILEYIECEKIDVNIERDNDKILELMQLSRKRNSILEVMPEIIDMWDYTNNGNLTPDMFSIGSEKIIYLKCTECGKSYQIKVKDAYKKRTTKCATCSFIRLKVGVNDFKTVYPKLAEEYDYEKNEIKLENLNLNEKRNKFYWKCKICGHEWKASIASRIGSTYCPKCAVAVGVNTRVQNIIKKQGSLLSNYPEIAKEWNYEKNGTLKPENMTCKNKKIVWWKCSICGNEWENAVALRTQGFGKCKKCYKK